MTTSIQDKAKLISARLAADICGGPTVLIARTDAEAAKLITSDIDERDQPFIVGQDRTSEGFYFIKNGVDTAIARGLAYSKFQQQEFTHGKEDGYMAITHQKFVGTGYFDRVINSITEGESSVEALAGSTEKDKF